jgi:hypothetical protein
MTRNSFNLSPVRPGSNPALATPRRFCHLLIGKLRIFVLVVFTSRNARVILQRELIPFACNGGPGGWPSRPLIFVSFAVT